MTGALSKVLRAFLRREISLEVDLVPLTLRDLPLSKVANWLLTEASVHFKPSRPWGLPTFVQVEPTSRCNLRCRICPTATGMGRESGNMDFDHFQRLVEQLSDSLLVMMFWDWGEPFLHPRAHEMIACARRAGMKVVASTNGHAFADPEQARRVVESAPDVLVFSIDGLSEETYQLYRAPGRLENALAGIRNVVAEKRRRAAAAPLVNFRFIVMRHNEAELPRTREFARSLGVDVLTIRRFYAAMGTFENARQEGAAMHPTRPEHRMPSGLAGEPPARRVAANPCRNLWNCPSIHWDGAVVSCCQDYREQRLLGRFPGHSFRQIWSGEAYRRLRRAFRRDYLEVPLCRACSCGFVGGDIGKDSTAEAIFFRNGD